jgi:glycosyltransferase involved in cell wall biosynthesis
MMIQKPINQQPATRNQKRVLMLLTNAFEPDPRVHQEAKSLVENGYCVTILCWDRDCKFLPQEVIEGIKIERIHVRSTHGRGSTQVPFLLLFWVKAYARASTKGFDIVHCHDFDTLPLGYLLAKPKRAKLIYDAHESYVDMLGNLPGWLKLAIYKVEDFLLKRTDLLITVGEILRGAFIRRGAKQTCVVGNWKDPSQFQFPPETLKEERKRLNIFNGQLVISFIANLGMERQLQPLIAAVKGSREIFLIIGGDGPCSEIAKEASQRYANIAYLGYVNPSKVPFYTALSDIIFYGFDPVNPNSKFSAPNKLFEALAAGKAVLTGDFGEIGGIVMETQCGLILKNFSEDQIKKGLLKLNLEVLNRFKENASRAALVKYNWKHASSTLLVHYNLLAGRQNIKSFIM